MAHILRVLLLYSLLAQCAVNRFCIFLIVLYNIFFLRCFFKRVFTFYAPNIPVFCGFVRFKNGFGGLIFPWFYGGISKSWFICAFEPNKTALSVYVKCHSNSVLLGFLGF